MQLLPQGLFLVLPLSLPSTPYCPRRPSLNSLPSHRLAVSNRGTSVKPRAIRCCHFYTARCTCRLQLMVNRWHMHPEVTSPTTCTIPSLEPSQQEIALGFPNDDAVLCNIRNKKFSCIDALIDLETAKAFIVKEEVAIDV
ncbi:unnamed protein product [Musa acuminata subsp. burmannicoides]